MASQRSWTPLLTRAEPSRTGTALSEMVARRSAATMSLALMSASARNLAMSSSSTSAMVSTSSVRAMAASSDSSAGTAVSRKRAPGEKSSQMRARCRMRSTSPLNSRKPSSSGTVIGICSTIGLALSRWRISLVTTPGSAPSRSHLLMKAMRGTL